MSVVALPPFTSFWQEYKMKEVINKATAVNLIKFFIVNSISF
jgi:hypothetical protein